MRLIVWAVGFCVVSATASSADDDGMELLKHAMTIDMFPSALRSFPCRSALSQSEPSSRSSVAINAYIIPRLAEEDRNLGSQDNIFDYLLSECRTHEDSNLGDASSLLLEDARLGRLPLIPVGGTADDQETRSERNAFDDWLHHKGPQPAFRVSDGHTSTIAPVEANAVISDIFRGDVGLTNSILGIVRKNDYKCDTISALTPFLSSRGYKISCNNYAYTYDVAHKGGHWTVTVE